MPTKLFDDLATPPQSETHEQPADQLARIAANLQAIAGVLAEYPARNPEVWKGQGWAKELRDLQIACERLREYARRVEDISARLANGRSEPR